MVRDDRPEEREPVAGEPGQDASLVRDLGGQDDVEGRDAVGRDEQQPLIIADTKFELGFDPDGNLVLGDEALTPDSSRFWPGEEYEPGRAQDSFDKQFVRDYCETTGWDKTEPGPELPDDVVQITRAKYHEAFERLTTIPFPAYLDDPRVVLG